ncbi:MAG: nuclear transport factor 2 family protein, partial [Chloroflexi bacterium]|nr:nuclear transport factor 2 family protein [Chloroflexota bacterium]
MSHISSPPPLNDEYYDDRIALRTMMGEVAGAINKKDWDAVRSHLDPQVIVTLIDQTTLHGPDALHQYAMSKLGHASSILSDIQVDPIPDSPATFYGDTAICPISSTDRFIFRNGREFLVPSRYTATVVRKDGVWKIAAMHGG